MKYKIKDVKIQANLQAVLPTSSYGNMRPGYLAEATVDIDASLSEQEVLDITSELQKKFRAVCLNNLDEDKKNALVIKIKEDLKNFRFLKDPVTGQEVPSVTSIQNYDKEHFVSDADLIVYAAQGNLIDAEFRNFAKTGVYKPSSELLECTADRHILKTRRLANGKYLSMDGWDIPGFVEKFEIKDMKSCDEPVFNRRYRYGGTPDIICTIGGVKTLLSVKRTYTETENFIQESAYANCEGMEDVKQMAVAEFKPEADGGNKCGYSKPRIQTEIEKYFQLFLRRRDEVIKIYGV